MGTKSQRGGNNKGKFGRKKGLTKWQVKQIIRLLKKNNELEELVIFYIALNTLLRGSDLQRLKGYHVLYENANGDPTTLHERILCTIFGEKALYFKVIKERFKITQHKTNQVVTVYLSKSTRKLLFQHIHKHQLLPDSCLLFFRNGTQLRTHNFRTLIKSLVERVGLNPALYSGHSTRRTSAVILFKKTKNIEIIRKALGHRNIRATIEYLGIEDIDVSDALKTIW